MNTISAFFVCSGFCVAAYIAIDVTKNKQSMRIMNIVWILTGLWGSYLALWAYKKFGREKKDMSNMNMKDDMSNMNMKDDMSNMNMKGDMSNMNMKDDMSNMNMKDDMSNMNMKGDMSNMNMKDDMSNMNMKSDMPGMSMNKVRPHWQSVALSALHCGAGCTLADILGESITYYFPIYVDGSTVLGGWIFDFILALIIGVYFQFYAIKEMENISIINAIKRAFKADFFSLTSWQIGMYGWMAIVYFVLFSPILKSVDFWVFGFMMQIAMLFGFVCAFPMNALLIKVGIKKGM